MFNLSKLKNKVLKNHKLTKKDAINLIDAPLDELCESANTIRKEFCGNKFDACTIINVKNGLCNEDCSFCAQSKHYNNKTNDDYPLLSKEELKEKSLSILNNGFLRISYVASGKKMSKNEITKISEVIKDCQNAFIKDTKNAKLNFYELRELQKKFENIYRNCSSFNLLGLALSCSDIRQKKEIIDYFINHYYDIKALKKFSLGILIDSKPGDEDYDEKASSVISILSGKKVYLDADAKEYAMRMLFMLNVMAADKRSSRFEFVYLDENGVWRNFYRDGRSLEHIWPKSRVVFMDEDGKNKTVKLKANNIEDEKEFAEVDSSKLNLFISRDLLESPKYDVTEHCIGNLVFLHSRDNSKFNAKTPEREGENKGKKQVFFDLDERILSRNLIQTIAAFSAGYWSMENTPQRIKDNKEETLRLIRKQYGLE